MSKWEIKVVGLQDCWNTDEMEASIQLWLDQNPEWEVVNFVSINGNLLVMFKKERKERP